MYISARSNEQSSNSSEVQLWQEISDVESCEIQGGSLTPEDATIAYLMLILQQMDREIAEQAAAIKGASGSSVESAALSRLMQKRSDMFSHMQSVLDSYESTAKSP